jgi:hypothetical protein
MKKEIQNKEIKVWKVLNKKDRSSVSAWMSNFFPGKFSLKYPVDKLVRPKIKKAKIFCFKYRKNAIKFVNGLYFGCDHLSIHRAIAINPIAIKWVSKDIKRLEYFWKKQVWLSGDTTLVSVYKAPEGTLVCDELKCLE